MSMNSQIFTLLTFKFYKVFAGNADRGGGGSVNFVSWSCEQMVVSEG